MTQATRVRKHHNDYNNGRCGFKGGNPRFNGKATSNMRGWRPQHTRSAARQVLREVLSSLPIEAAEQAQEDAEQARIAKILEVSQGQYRLEVSTEVWENYGYRHKPKGGNQYQVRFSVQPTDAQLQAAIKAVSDKVTSHSTEEVHSYDEWVIDAQLYGPTQETPAEQEIRVLHTEGFLTDDHRDNWLKSLTLKL